jgi:hypothetical protein
MIEIFAITFQFFILHLFFSTPFNLNNYKKLNLQLSLNYFDVIFCNIILQIFILLIISFLKINLFFYFLIVLIISLITNFSFLKKKLFQSINIYTIIFPIICLSIFFEIAHHAILDWDGLEHWFWKVNNFYQNQDIGNINNLPLPQYPHLGSYLWSFFWKNSLFNYEYIGRLFIPYIYIVSLFTICADIKNRLYGILFIILLLAASYDIFLFSGYQEYITFSYICFLTKFIFLNKKNYYDKLFSYALILIASFCLLWIKQECFFYVIFFNFCFIFFVKNKNLEKIYFTVIFFFFIILYLLIEKYLKGNIGYQVRFDLSNLKKFKEIELIAIYIIEITKHIIIAFFKYPILIFNIFILFFINLKIKQNNEYRFILFFFLLNFIFLYGIYFIHPSTLEEMLPNTVDRLLFQVSSIGVVFMGRWVNKISI